MSWLDAFTKAKAVLNSAKGEFRPANENSDKLKAECVNSSITHADRASTREQEILLLKEVLKDSRTLKVVTLSARVSSS